MKHFLRYKPFFKGVRKSSRMSLMIKFFFMARRLANLYVYMFMSEHPGLQVIIFMALSLISLMYLVSFKPYKKRVNNYLFILNEIITLFVAYHVMVINGMCNEVESY